MTAPAGAVALADGQTIAVRRIGSGPAVVCVPGGPARDVAYLGDLGGLDARATLHLLDNRGSGGSRPADLTTITVEQMGRDLVEAVGLLGLAGPDRPVLLAHSFGARVVGKALELAPDLARAVVLVTPGPFVLDPSVFAPARAAVVEARAADPVYAEAVEAARALPAARPRDRSFLEEMSLPLWYGRWDGAAQQHAAEARGQVDVRTAMTLRRDAGYYTPPDLAALAVPVLTIAGTLDMLSPPIAVRGVADLFGSSYVEMVGAGHFPWLDDPAAFVGIVGDALAYED